jgi:hypothetical protein
MLHTVLQVRDKHDVMAYTTNNASFIGLAGLVAGLQEAFYHFEVRGSVRLHPQPSNNMLSMGKCSNIALDQWLDRSSATVHAAENASRPDAAHIPPGGHSGRHCGAQNAAGCSHGRCFLLHRGLAGECARQA